MKGQLSVICYCICALLATGCQKKNLSPVTTQATASPVVTPPTIETFVGVLSDTFRVDGSYPCAGGPFYFTHQHYEVYVTHVANDSITFSGSGAFNIECDDHSNVLITGTSKINDSGVYYAYFVPFYKNYHPLIGSKVIAIRVSENGLDLKWDSSFPIYCTDEGYTSGAFSGQKK